MSNPALHHKINYIEFTTTDIERTKKFYSTVFGWSFKDWGPDYIDCNADCFRHRHRLCQGSGASGAA